MPRRRRGADEIYGESDPRGLPAAGGRRQPAETILWLQQRAGNRAVASLLARQPATDEDRAKQAESKLGPDSRKSGESPEPVEYEQFGPLAKFQAEYLEEALHTTGLPKRLLGLVGRAWDVFELVEFARTGDAEHLGAPAATLAGKAADIAAEKIEEGFASRTAIVTKVGGRVFLVAWTTYEAFKLGAYIRGAIDAQDRAEKASRDAWRYAMMQHVWIDYLSDLAAQREETFDLMLGGTQSYGQVPGLSKRAAIKGVEMMNEASDRWKVKLQIWHAHARYLAEHRDDGPEYNPGYGETIHGVDMYRRRMWIKEIIQDLAEDFQRIRDFDNDPSNWWLTEKQYELLRTSTQAGWWDDQDWAHAFRG